jgi:hypothetical protein
VFAEYGQRDEEGPALVMVIEGADAREAEALKNELGIEGMIAVADPTGAITGRFGVGVWPTTIALDASGVVLEVSTGLARDA